MHGRAHLNLNKTLSYQHAGEKESANTYKVLSNTQLHELGLVLMKTEYYSLSQQNLHIYPHEDRFSLVQISQCISTRFDLKWAPLKITKKISRFTSFPITKYLCLSVSITENKDPFPPDRPTCKGLSVKCAEEKFSWNCRVTPIGSHSLPYQRSCHSMHTSAHVLINFVTLTPIEWQNNEQSQRTN